MKVNLVPQHRATNPHCELNEMAFVNSGPTALAEGNLPDCLTLWRCIGCGAMGSVEQCTGSCAYQKLDVVGAEDHADFLEHFGAINVQARRLEPVVRQIAALGEEHPDHERAYRSLQKSARTLIRSLDHRAISARNAMVPEDERATVWWCATCGQVEAPQSCLGICIRRNGDFVRSQDHDELAARVELAQRGTREMASLVHQLAWVTPRTGEWDSACRAFQNKAIKLLKPRPAAHVSPVDSSPPVCPEQKPNGLGIE
jgi:hypothetical protein